MDRFILSIEDNADDILLFGMAFRKAKLSVPVEFVMDGEKAIEYFSPSDARRLPSLVLLDLKLPKSRASKSSPGSARSRTSNGFPS